MLNELRAATRRNLLKRGILVVRLHRGFHPPKRSYSGMHKYPKTVRAPWLIIPWSRAGSMSLQVGLSMHPSLAVLPREHLDSILVSKDVQESLRGAIFEGMQSRRSATTSSQPVLMTHDTSLLFSSSDRLRAVAGLEPERISVVMRHPFDVVVSSYNHLLHNLTEPSLYDFSALGLSWPVTHLDESFMAEEVVSVREFRSRIPELMTFHGSNFARDLDMLISRPKLGSLSEVTDTPIEVFPSTVASDASMLRHFLPPTFSDVDIDKIVSAPPANDSLSRYLDSNPVRVALLGRVIEIGLVPSPWSLVRSNSIRIPLSFTPSIVQAVVRGRDISRQVVPTISIDDAKGLAPSHLAELCAWATSNLPRAIEAFSSNVALIDELITPSLATRSSEILSREQVLAIADDLEWLVTTYPEHMTSWLDPNSSYS